MVIYQKKKKFQFIIYNQIPHRQDIRNVGSQQKKEKDKNEIWNPKQKYDMFLGS